MSSVEDNVIRPLGSNEVFCGYCKGERSHLVNKSPSESSTSYGLLVETMTPAVYEAFISRGWRRSGIHLYKPSNFESCCPTLSIRLLVANFRMSKSQTRLWRKMQRLLRPLQTPQPSSSFKKEQKQPKKKKKKTIQPDDQGPGPNDNEDAAISAKRGTTVSLEEQAVRDSAVWAMLDRMARQTLSATLSSPEIRNWFLMDSTTPSTTSISSSSASSSSSPLPPSHTPHSPGIPQNDILTSILNNISWKIRKPSKQDTKLGKIQATCNVCAQLAGRFKLQTNRRNQLLGATVANWNHQLPQLLKEGMMEMANKDDENGNDNNNNNESTGVFSITSVEAHNGSGQIVATLQLKANSKNNNDIKNRRNQEIVDVIMKEPKDLSSQDGDNINKKTISINSKSDHDDFTARNIAVDDDNDIIMNDSSSFTNDDKLGQWYQQQTGNRLAVSDRKILVKTIPAHQSALLPETHRLYAEYQHAVHQDPDPFVFDPQQPPESIDLDQLDWGNAPQYFKDQIGPMLREYMKASCKDGNNDKAIRDNILANYYSYYQFLVESPFPIPPDSPSKQREKEGGDPVYAGNNCTETTKNRPTSCGTYHQHYMIGNVLIAVGVVDLLPQGLSSVYLYYSPTFSHTLVALGKYAILYEVEYTRKTCQLPYYYLGYYIESCPKMRYKGDYKPSQLLCPVHFQWVDAVPAVEALKKTSPLHVCALYGEQQDVEGEVKETENDKDSNATKTSLPSKQQMTGALNEINLDIGAGVNITLPMLQESGKEVVEPILNDFLKEAGPELAKRCLVKLA